MAEQNILDLREDVDAATLRKVLIPHRLPRAERYRTYFGKSADLNRIQAALLQADGGLMVELTDLESEMMALDPHLSAVMRKRVGSIQCLDWRLEPAKGTGVDAKLAEQIADVVRQHLEAIPRFNAHLVDLGWATFYNRAALEIHWAVQGGAVRWRPTELSWIHPRRLAFGPERELRLINTFRRLSDFVEQGFALRDYPGKFLSWQPRLFNEYPEREGLGPRVLYWAYFKRFSWRMRMALTELFGIPWRIIETDKDAPVNTDAIDAAFEAAEKLGETTAAAFGPGMKLNIPQTGDQKGELFGMTTEEVNGEVSKLVLGQPGTTDAVANRAETIVQKGEQDIILASDAEGISSSVQRDVVNVDVALNYGDAAIAHSPKFVIDTTPPRDATKELERITQVVSLGVPVPVAEVREAGGTREPAEEEEFVIGSQNEAGTTVFDIVDPNAPAPEPVAPVAPGTVPSLDDTLAAAGGLEAEGPEGQVERAEAEQLARSFGLPFDSAVRALRACDAGQARELFAIPGLGTDDIKWLVERRLRVAHVVPIALDGHTRVHDNHGHELHIPDSDIVSGSTQAYQMRGGGDHDHTLTLTRAHQMLLLAGEEIEVESSEGGLVTPHTHVVTVSRTGTQVDIDYADLERDGGTEVPPPRPFRW